MSGIVPELRRSDKEWLSKQLGQCTATRQRTRSLIIVILFDGRSAADTVSALRVGRSPRLRRCQTMVRKAGGRIHVSTMSMALKMISARQGRPKPTVSCP